MARVVIIVLCALFALFCGVHAKSKEDQIRLYQFVTDLCDGNPLGSNIDLKRNNCVNINARSIKPRIDEKRKKWVDDVNHGVVECGLYVYDVPNCPADQAVAMMTLPGEIDQCFTHGSPSTFRSVKFTCGQAIEIIDSSIITTTIMATSWSIGKDYKPTPYATTKTFTVTSDRLTLPARATSAVAHRLEPRAKKGDIKGVWMYHPWSASVLCYECYTNKPGNWKWVKCHSGANVDEYCGPRPVVINGEPLTTTTIRLSETTTTMTISPVAPLPSTSTTTTQVPLQARSWHRSVHFRHPWTNVRVCADAEWEKRGQPDYEIRLQDVHADDGNDCSNAQSLDLPDPIVETISDTTTLTDTITSWVYTATTTVTVTEYISVSTSTSTAPSFPIINPPTTVTSTTPSVATSVETSVATVILPTTVTTTIPVVSSTTIPIVSSITVSSGVPTTITIPIVAAAAAEDAVPTHTDL